MKKRIVAILMTAAVITSMFTACAGAAGTAAESAGQAAEAVTETAEEVAEAAGEAVEAAGEWEGDIDEIVVMFADMGGKGENFGPALEAMNAITEKTIGVHADVKLLNMGDFTTQVGLALAAANSSTS